MLLMDFQGRARSPLRAVFGQIGAQTAAKGLAALPLEYWIRFLGGRSFLAAACVLTFCS
jgi:hypothetical protein